MEERADADDWLGRVKSGIHKSQIVTLYGHIQSSIEVEGTYDNLITWFWLTKKDIDPDDLLRFVLCLAVIDTLSYEEVGNAWDAYLDEILSHPYYQLFLSLDRSADNQLPVDLADIRVALNQRQKLANVLGGRSFETQKRGIWPNRSEAVANRSKWLGLTRPCR